MVGVEAGRAEVVTVGSGTIVGVMTAAAGCSAMGGSNQKFPSTSSQKEQVAHAGSRSLTSVGTASIGLKSLHIVLHSAGTSLLNSLRISVLQRSAHL